MSKKKKRWLWISIGIIVLLIVFAIVKKSGSDELNVTTATSEMRTITETVVANGKIQPETEVVISSEVSGKILELPFKEGARVSKGDLLVRINPDLAQAALDRAEAAQNNARANKANAEARLIQAESQLRNNRTIYTRSQSLYDQNVISEAEFDNTKATFETAEAEVVAAKESVKAAAFSVQSAQASVKEASDSYSRTTIYAPMDGTISRLTAEVGEQVVGAMQMTGTEIMRVANLDVMEVLVDVNESDIVRVNFGDTTAIEVDAYLDRKFTGVVTEIANSANSTGQTADQVTNFEVKIRILSTSYADLVKADQPGLSPFRPGMNATVDIRTATKTDVITVPIESITSRTDTTSGKNKSATEKLLGDKIADKDQKPVTCVFIESEGKAVLKPVSTGIQDDKYIEVLEGLEAGEKVIAGPYDIVSQRLSPGDKVTVVDKEDLYKKN